MIFPDWGTAPETNESPLPLFREWAVDWESGALALRGGEPYTLEGDEAVKGEGLCEAESVKAVSEIYSPVNGSVRRVNRALEDAPESVNDAPYDAWMVELENVTGAEDLMDAAAYREFLKSEGHD